MTDFPIEPTGWTGFVARRQCRQDGGHYWHVATPMAGIACCQCGARDDLRPKTKLCDDGPYTAPECRGADFSQVAYALGQGLIDHADRDGLKGVRRAVFMDRGGHAVGEACPTAKPADPHRYWCQYPDDECTCDPDGPYTEQETTNG